MNIVRCPKPYKKGSKRKTAVFAVKSHFAARKSATEFFCVKTVSDKIVYKTFIGLSIRV